MKRIFILLLAVSLLGSCHRQDALTGAGITDQSTLNFLSFSVNTKKDTVLQTAEGMKIKIAANSLSASSATITVQIKEAYTIEEMIQAGLTTQSGKEILSSDGMFYIGFAEEVTIKKSMQVSFPSAFVNNRMQLYKGKETDGGLQWQDPAPIDSLVTPAADRGKLLFANNCASCHAVDKRLTGPPLAWIDKRKSREWLHALVRNTAEVMKSDQQLACLYREYQVLMTSFPDLEHEAIDDIFSYIDKVSQEKNVPKSFNPDAAYDSCATIRAEYLQLLRVRDSLSLDNIKKPDLSNNTTLAPNDTTRTPPVSQAVSTITPPTVSVDYYQLDISAAGWYNIDVLLHRCDGITDSKLMVRIQGEYQDRLRIFLAIPSEKVFIEGGLLDDKKSYGFNETNGTIPLPQGTTAMVFAYREKDKKLYYAESKFITSLSQTPTLSLQESSLTAIQASLSSVSLPPEIINKAKNYKNISEVDKKLQNIMPAAKQCDCGFSDVFPETESEDMGVKSSSVANNIIYDRVKDTPEVDTIGAKSTGSIP